jgi:glycosyltransferase involved in cell wall biosynthesis
MTSVRTGIDLNRFQPLDKTAMRTKLRLPENPMIGILATLRDWKGHDYLIDALKLLRTQFPEWRLIIIGDGPQLARLTSRVQKENLAEIVRFVGNVDNVPEWLSTLDIFTLPSFGDEGVPQGIMQAMACGLPVVSTPVGAITEALQDGSTGILVAPKNAAALAAALEQLMADEALRQHMGQAGRAYALASFGINAMLDRMTDVFVRALKAREER